MLNLDEKKCSNCKEVKHLCHFYQQKDKPRAACKTCELADKKKYYLENKDSIKDKRNSYYKLNTVKVREQESRYRKKRRIKDPEFKLKNSVRNHVYQFLTKNKINKSITYLGCSLAVLKKYLESKWLENMTWENYGRNGWHIDHIHPLSKADFTNLEDVRKVLHYTNLQPLWAVDNIKKGNKI